MSYRLQAHREVAKDIKKIDKKEHPKIKERINSLAHNSKPAGCEKLQSVDAYRVRVGNYRIVYQVDEVGEIVTIRCVSHRKNVYKASMTRLKQQLRNSAITDQM